MTKISDYAKAEMAKITEVTDEKNGEKQLYQDFVDLQTEYKVVLDLSANLMSNIESAIKYKVSGRTDVTRMYLAKVRYELAVVTYKTHLVARDLATWYQDYFTFKA